MSRVSHLMTSRLVLQDIHGGAERLARTQRKLASGKELGRPSDNPFDVQRALSLRTELEGTRQYARNVNDAIGWQTVTDIALSKIGDATQRVRELVIQGASDSNSQSSRDAIAAEVDQLIDAVKQEANTTFAGRYVFAGTATSTRPYALGAADGYTGQPSPSTIAREIGPGVAVQVNVVARDVLGDGQAAGDNRLLDVLRDVAADLRGGNGDALRGTDLARLDQNLDEIARQRALVGAMTNRLEIAGARLSEIEESASTLLSEAEDADMAKAMIDFSMQQSVYQAALKSGANIVQASLLDFLR